MSLNDGGGEKKINGCTDYFIVSFGNIRGNGGTDCGRVDSCQQR